MIIHDYTFIVGSFMEQLKWKSLTNPKKDIRNISVDMGLDVINKKIIKDF